MPKVGPIERLSLSMMLPDPVLQETRGSNTLEPVTRLGDNVVLGKGLVK
jgi:hypothetical protein